MFQKQPNFKSSLAAKFLFQKPVLYNVNNADYVFSYGGKIDDVVKSIGVSEKKIISIPTGIEESWLAQAPLVNSTDKTKFLFVGRFERRKGVEELNKALLLLKDKSNFEFHFVGPIPETNKLNFSHVFYHGSITDAEIMKAKVKEMDVLVCPSHSEGMPNVIMEAMASGLAVIATDVGAVKLMVDESNGVLLQSSNPNEIASAIEKLSKLDKNILQQMKLASIEKVRSNFLWSNVIDETILKIKGVITKS
jgi:glycosyltransferase involved in cell wall biosynthesis